MHRWEDPRPIDPLAARGLGIIGQSVCRKRVGSGMSQRQLAFQAGVNQSTISRLERGQLRAMRFFTLARIIGVINLHPNDLLPGGPPVATRRLPGQPPVS